jgi:acetyl esterase/lipase
MNLLKNRIFKNFALIFSIVFGLFASGTMALWCFHCAAQEPAVPPTVTVEKDVIFGYADKQPLRMDVVRPIYNSSVLPVVICIHGGGWAAGDKKDMLGLAYGVAALGYEAVSINYRLAPQSKYPCQVEDVTAVLDYLRTHAREMKIDSKKMAALGSSAGGHLALLLAETSENNELGSKTKPSALRAACSIAGPTDLTREFSDTGKNILKGFFGFPKETNPEAYQKASPSFCLTKKCAPLLLIHGDQDPLVPYSQATSMVELCSSKGVPAELYTLHNAGHMGGDPKELQAALMKLAEFLDKNLRQ